MLTMHRYLRSAQHHWEKIRDFVMEMNPDVAGLVEIDTGSIRSGRRNQVAELARSLTHFPVYGGKYGGKSIANYLPILRHQGNAILAREEPQHCQSHFFEAGLKRLIVEVNVLGVTFFLVHLALGPRIRELQLKHLATLIGQARKPVILAGDFNTFQGGEELVGLMAATGLRRVRRRPAPTYPSYKPKSELDFILCSEHIEVENFAVLEHIRYSDHLPLVLDFQVRK
jgi:endonuclease/exonuclease/phosphatase family metal-dependent hydrolase